MSYAYFPRRFGRPDACTVYLVHRSVCSTPYVVRLMMYMRVHQICRWSHTIWYAYFPKHLGRPHTCTDLLCAQKCVQHPLFGQAYNVHACIRFIDGHMGFRVHTFPGVLDIYMRAQVFLACRSVCSTPYVVRLIMCTRASNVKIIT
jgi:hypothetical protein